jgi:hypothetical protein
MSIFEDLKTNKGTVSSALGKKLAVDVLNGTPGILDEAVDLTCFQVKNRKEKNIRSGAAKIVECVAMEKPELVAPFMEKLLPALTVDEPQTRWMIIRTIGLCASLRPDIARQAIPYARKYIREKAAGQLCLVSSADLYLGDFGAISTENAREVQPILLESTDNVILNEQDWLMEAFIKIVRNLGPKEKEEIDSIAREYSNVSRKTTQARAKQLMALCR